MPTSVTDPRIPGVPIRLSIAKSEVPAGEVNLLIPPTVRQRLYVTAEVQSPTRVLACNGESVQQAINGVVELFYARMKDL